MSDGALRNVDPELYRHPGEREARTRLEMMPGFQMFLDAAARRISGKAERQSEIASMVRVSTGVYPRLDEIWRETLACFGLPGAPLHVGFLDPQPWAVRGDDGHPRAVLSSIMLDSIPEDEMTALLAMIAGSFRLGHVRYLAVGDFLRRMQDFSGIAAAPALMIFCAFENWRRAASFSSDRAAALAVRDSRPVLSLLERLAGAKSRAWGGVGEPERLRLQGLEAAAWRDDWQTGAWQRFALSMNRRNNAALARRLDLAEWTERDRCRAILAGDAEGLEPEAGGTEGAPDPGLAFWGEFAAPENEGDGQAEGGLKSAAEGLRDAAEKGVDSFLRVGDAFWKSFLDKMQPW